MTPLEAMALTLERACEMLDYEPDTGVFRWKRPQHGVRVGEVAGTIHSTGYRIIYLDLKRYRAHRLAWFMSYGAWPDHEIDHINRCPLDNRLSNLRQATRRQNSGNLNKSKRNKSGYKGVLQRKDTMKWYATIGTRFVAGPYLTRNEAARSRVLAASRYFGIARRDPHEIA